MPQKNQTEVIKDCNCGFDGVIYQRCDKCFQYNIPLFIKEEISRNTIKDRRRKVDGWTFVNLVVICPVCNEAYQKRVAFYPHLSCNGKIMKLYKVVGKI